MLLKKGSVYGYAYKPCYSRAGFALSGPLVFGDFRNIFLPIIDEDQQKVLPSERGPLALHMVNPTLVVALRS